MKSILFVDDEPHVLDGLRRSLRRQREVWDMCFAEGGEQGLALLAQRPFDVVVTDMRMPRVDGSELLSRVRELHPDTVRIVLSGHTELDAALRTVPVAHQFIAKPCEGSHLRLVIERVCDLRERLGSEHLRRLVSRVGSLPTAPRVYLELTRALEDEATSAQDVAAIVERDVAMAAKVLQIVNSAFFSLPREVPSLREAVAYLGVDTLRALTLSVEAFRPFRESSGALTEADLEEEQRRALLCGALARRIAPDPKSGERAFMAAMLHDVGRLVLASQLPDEFCRTADAARRDGRPVQAHERELLGTTHSEVGAYLLGTWGLPHAIIEAVAHHHHPQAVEHSTFEVLSVVHVSALLGRAARALPQRPETWAADLDLDYLDRLGVRERLPEWIALADEEATAQRKEAA